MTLCRLKKEKSENIKFYLQIGKAYDILQIGKSNKYYRKVTIKPHERQLMGFFIPFWQGGLNLRLVANYSFLSNHLQM